MEEEGKMIMRRIGMTILLVLIFCILGGLGGALAERTLSLPASLEVIEDEAFMNDTSLERVVVPEGVRRIGARAFAGSSASWVELPGSLTDIADDAFSGADGMTVYVYADSYAQAWCERNSRPCKLVGSDEAKVSLAYAEVNPLDGTVFGVLANAFKQKAEELSGGSVEIVISDQAWAKLSEKQQRWVEQAAQYASRVFDAQNTADEALALAALTDKGVTVTAVDDKTPFIEACRDLISANIPDGLAALYQQIIDLK